VPDPNDLQVLFPRAIALFRKQGMDPIPAPAAHLVKERSNRAPEDFFPSGGSLQETQMAVHEYLGILWSKFMGLI
jgi:uncharacterized SAM-binding protein YcdF (DUF218 family)